MPTTDPYGQNIQYSLLSDPPNAQTLGQEIVPSVVPQTVMRFSSASGRAAVLAGAQAPVAGMLTYLKAEDQYEAYTSGQGWVPITPGPWQPLPYATGITAYNGSPGYRLTNGAVELRGQVSRSDSSAFVSNGTTGYLLGTLPSGYRPSYYPELVVATELATNYYCRLQVGSDGTITAWIPTGGSPHWISLDGVRVSIL